MNTPLIDSHCHLHYDYTPKSSEDLVREAEAAGISALVTVATDLASLPLVEKISTQFRNVWHTIGVHPHDVKDLMDSHLPELESRARHPKCVAVGEIGLDYHYDHSPRDIQIKRLEDQLCMALKVGLPVVIHARDAETDLIEALNRYAKQVPAGRPPGVIHCFTGTRSFGEACVDSGFYISFSGIITFANSADLRETARALPLERLMVETDSPFLAPVPLRGKKCEPAMITHTALKLALIKGISLDEVSRITTRNAQEVFKLRG